MKIRSSVAAASIGLIFLLVFENSAESAELKVLTAIGIQTVMEDLGPKFERATGHKLAITFANAGTTVKRIQDGETADVVITTQPGIESFVRDGKAVADNVTILARSGIGLAVRNGAPKPDISSPEAFKRTLLAAKSIAYSNPAGGASSGIHFATVLDRLGIANEMKSKTIFPKSGRVGVLVANGEAELAVAQIQELMSVAGIEIIGPLPGDLQDNIVFSAAIMASSRDTEASRSLINFLRTPQASAVINANGMEPAIP